MLILGILSPVSCISHLPETYASNGVKARVIIVQRPRTIKMEEFRCHHSNMIHRVLKLWRTYKKNFFFFLNAQIYFFAFINCRHLGAKIEMYTALMPTTTKSSDTPNLANEAIVHGSRHLYTPSLLGLSSLFKGTVTYFSPCRLQDSTCHLLG